MPEPKESFRIGTAGWSISKQYREDFPGTGTHLQRYASIFSAVEINSSFYRPHKPVTYKRWSDSVPTDFKFAAKIPREITHQRRLIQSAEILQKFLHEVGHLEEKLGPLLVQLPPSLRYDETVVKNFFSLFRELYSGQIACEPRHATWFTEAASDLLVTFRVACVAADPACVPRAGKPGGWPSLVYRRLHGSPKIYYSAYSSDDVATTAAEMVRGKSTAEQWCIFDNTAVGEATRNALDLKKLVAAA